MVLFGKLIVGELTRVVTLKVNYLSSAKLFHLCLIQFFFCGFFFKFLSFIFISLILKTSTEVHEESMQRGEDQESTKEDTPSTIPSAKPSLENDDKSEKESAKVTPNQRKNPPPSPNSRKRRFEESSVGSMVQVPASYIKQSSLAGKGPGKGHASPGFHSPVSDKLLANAKKKLTPQDSLESDHGGLVEVPPSYIKSGSYHRPVSRSPTRQRLSTTPKGTTTGSAHLASPSISVEEPSVGDSSHLTSWGTPLKDPSDRDSTKLPTWASPAVDMTNGSAHFTGASVSDPLYVNSLSDSFFLNNDQTGEMPDRHADQQQHTSSYSKPWVNCH